MQDKIEEIKKQAEEKIKEIKNSQELQELKVKMLGKKSELSNLLKGLGKLSPEERPKVGALVNEARKTIEEKIAIAEDAIMENMLAEKIEEETIDITLPGTKIKRGSKHPVNRVIEEIEDLFVSMGYDVVSGPELETDEFCFERLNLPKGHPARDMQDSFYITNEYLLRTQTSAVQARTMLANSEFIIMLNQASTDRLKLAKLLNISELQMGYITNVGAGQGLIKVGSNLVPFINKFPKNTKLYKLMTTKPGESEE